MASPPFGSDSGLDLVLRRHLPYKPVSGKLAAPRGSALASERHGACSSLTLGVGAVVQLCLTGTGLSQHNHVANMQQNYRTRSRRQNNELARGLCVQLLIKYALVKVCKGKKKKRGM